jgi:NAD(P)-dependent dehydrogenase (short-subunit alcohol dehydrogenase family)
MKILIFGVTGGIGSALARRLIGAGHTVFGSARDSTRLAALGAQIGFSSLPGDVTRSNEVDRVFQTADSILGGIDGVALCVGSILLKPAHLTSDEEWHATMAVNLHSAFYVTRAAARSMQRAGGSIVLVSTCAARVGLPNHEAIAAAKAGLEGLARSAAATYAPRQIRINVVAPGLVNTPLAARITGNEAALKASVAMHPLGRIGEPDDVASAIAWLLDPAQGWVTGQTIGVDGGLASLRGRST